jgi:simple sugar transport system ATP-binding protein
MKDFENKLLELQGISKYFGDAAANESINLHLFGGEVLALLGENGAGKSTLMNIIYGIYHPDAGRILIRGREVKISSPKDAMAHGIGMVHQHFMLVGRMNAVQNVCLIDRRASLSVLNSKKVRASLEKLKEQYQIEVDLDCPVEQLSISMQQKIEILKLLYTGADILILDEPTAVLLPQECQTLFDIIQHMTAQNKGVIFISHKLNEVLQISDRIDVLSHGKVTGHVHTADASQDLIIRMMSGDHLPDFSGYVKKPAQDTICLSCKKVEAFDDRNVKTLNGVDLTVHYGEIVGVAGVEGNGQNELAEVLAGVRHTSSGEIQVAGNVMNSAKAGCFIDSGVGYIPSDRNTVGTVPDFPLYENWLLRSRNYPKWHGLTDLHAVQRQTSCAMEDFDVRAAGCMTRSANLSGGNLQKFILARELEGNPRVLICSYPTRGLDMKASWFIRSQLTHAKEAGTGIVLFSGDLDELFAISDRIVVLYRGRVAGERYPEKTTPQNMILMMMGGQA